MADQSDDKPKGLDPEEFMNSMMRLTLEGQRIMGDFLSRQAGQGAQTPCQNPHETADSQEIINSFMEITSRMLSNPEKLVKSQTDLLKDHADLWRNTAERMQGVEVDPVAVPDNDDRRFKDEAWSETAVFDFIKQSYLLTSRWIQSAVRDGGADEKTNFVTRQFVNAMSPSNFAATNPEVIRETSETGGRNLFNGLKNLLNDMDMDAGTLHIKMCAPDAFQVGENIAVTPGKVVFRNDLMELIQYAPTTKTVRKRPLLITPPWINKYYILDLAEKNSLIKWTVEQGNTVFVISWVNPGADLAEKTFDDYMLEGPLAALDAIEKATGEKNVNAVGYCIGGTLLACALAWMAVNKDTRVKSATFLTTMMDFSEPGELGVFIDEKQVAGLEEKMDARGYLDGSDMANVFNLLRENDLIWSFYINNYLLGKGPAPFDLLYWNSDSTRLPAAMHSFYLRNMYLQNKLAIAGGLTLAGVPIDLAKVKTPAYVLSTREDHIAPWKSTYHATALLSGPVKFVLAASGHIAGVVNPPAKNKYCHWTNPKTEKDPDDWLDAAKATEGSWWPDWDKWLKKHKGGKDVKPRVPKKGLEDAPGSYVKVRAG